MPSNNSLEQPQKERIHFVTGRLAEHVVRSVVKEVADDVGFHYTIDVLPITVAALMTSKWLQRHIQVPVGTTRIVVPGYLESVTDELTQSIGTKVVAGPRDIRDLPEFFGKKATGVALPDAHSVEIIAEINHAPRIALTQLVAMAEALQSEGADIIDLGCDPGHRWLQVHDAVCALRDKGIRVSIDSFDPDEVHDACRAGACLVLSVNRSNVRRAADWGCEVVVIPDTPEDRQSLLDSIQLLSDCNVPFRIDPILEPIGCGFTASIQRYIDCRQRFPHAKMMMGIGNITELTDVDSAGVNAVLLGICEELRIESVLTTQVINWARSSVRECQIARRLMHYACQHRVPPKNLSTELVVLRDRSLKTFPVEIFDGLASSIRDANIRIFAQNDTIHVVTRGVHLWGADPFDVMQRLLATEVGKTIDASHAFYLGYELSKALTALTLGKQYEQDRALDWGFLTRHEDLHRIR